jgi:hypothetical protein
METRKTNFSRKKISLNLSWANTTFYEYNYSNTRKGNTFKVRFQVDNYSFEYLMSVCLRRERKKMSFSILQRELSETMDQETLANVQAILTKKIKDKVIASTLHATQILHVY